MEKRFLGAPLSAVTAIGKIVVAAARLESVAHDILQDLTATTSRRQIEDVLREIRRGVRAGLPPHARVSGDTLVEWTFRVGDAMRGRHIAPHSAVLSRFDGGQWVPHLQHIRSRSMTDLDADALTNLANRLAELAHEGSDLHHGLLRQPADRVYLRNVIRQNEPWVLIAHGKDPDFPRPTDDEINTWLRTFPPQVIH